MAQAEIVLASGCESTVAFVGTDNKLTIRAYRGKRYALMLLNEPKAGLEPATYSLRMNCSTN